MDAKLQALKVPELKALLQRASLPVTGKKEDLIKRLLENPTAVNGLDDAAEGTTAPAASAPSTSDSLAVPITAAASSPAVVSAPATTRPSESEQRDLLIAELEKRKARAARFGQPLGEAEAKLERAIKFGISSVEDQGMKKLDGELKKGRVEKEPKAAKAKPPPAKVDASRAGETDEDKSARIARQEADEAAKKRRAERFGLGPDTAEEEKKRKRDEKFGAEAQKKAKDA